jgi:hypothetical protein
MRNFSLRHGWWLGYRSRQVAATRGKGADRDGSALVAEASASGEAAGVKWAFRTRATGLWAACLVVFVAIALELVMLDHKNPQHFMLICFTCLSAGVALASAVGSGRLNDALTDKDLYRTELNRVTERNAVLESRFLKKRESSVPPA